MNPIRTYLKNIFAAKRVLGENLELQGLVKADSLLQDLYAKNKFPGLSITVLKEGKTIFQKAYGFADVVEKTTIDPQQTIFRIASVSKPIAATALACMVQEGILDLDASFYTYVPDYPKKRWDFTIRQLASHTAGIRAYKGKEYGLNELLTIKDSLRVFKDSPLLFEPGKGYLYTSFDWVLISLAMQEASGIPFEKYVQERVLNPLGMMNTFVPEPPNGKDKNVRFLQDTSRKATFYTKVGAGFRKAIPVDNFYKLAGGGYLSTSEDIAKLGQAYLGNKIGVKEGILNQFLTSQQVNGKKIYYGLGWQVSEDSHGRKFYGHVGNGVGGYSNFFIYPAEQLVFSILINCTDPKIQPELDTVIDCFFSQVES